MALVLYCSPHPEHEEAARLEFLRLVGDEGEERTTFDVGEVRGWPDLDPSIRLDMGGPFFWALATIS